METESPPVLIESTYLPISILKRYPVLRLLRYLISRLLVVTITIFLGVFISVVISNHGGMLDQIAQNRIDSQLVIMKYAGTPQEELDSNRAELEKEEGLTLSFWPKHLLYSIKALSLDWGDVRNIKKYGIYIRTPNGEIRTGNTHTIILSRLPNTLLLSGSAYLLVVILAITLALYSSQREGHSVDRILSILQPISSVPSWVIGVLLVYVFAVQFKIFPAGTMTGLQPPTNTWNSILTIAYHLVLPVLAIVLSLIFQLTANWRTFLMIFSEEDYVSMGKAKGLPQRMLEKRYLLRPVLPYVLTSFVIALVGFWQTITALEFFYQWPGIGKLYVDSLPNFHGENMSPGELGIIVGIIVLFAYILGGTVILLDLLYLLLDPRIRLQIQTPSYSIRIHKAKIERKLPQARNKSRAVRLSFDFVHISIFESVKAKATEFIQWRREIDLKFFQALKIIFHDSVSLSGFVLVALLLFISLFVIIFFPYRNIGREWETIQHDPLPSKAKLAQPVWTNWFRKDDLPKTILLDSSTNFASNPLDGTHVEKVVTIDPSGSTQIQINFDFMYPYKYFPGEIGLLLTPEFVEKPPFVSLTWVLANGEVINLQNIGVDKQIRYDFDSGISYRKAALLWPRLKDWFISSGNYRTPTYYLLFADTQAESAIVQSGEYHLRILSTHFEPQGNMDARLILYGKVEGLAGTDYLRRDLLVPLLWGLPFAIFIGLLGSIATTILSLTIAAISAWYGGWIDNLIQRLIEANLILPVMAIGVLLYAYYGFNLWLIIALIVLLNVLGSPTKAFRAAFLQVREDTFIEAARAYGASDWRMITHYLIPRILPVVIPQIIALVPNFFFLEATLAIFNISDTRFPTWGRVIYSALRYGATYGSPFWVLEPIALMLITSVAFVLLGQGVNRILNPKLRGA